MWCFNCGLQAFQWDHSSNIFAWFVGKYHPLLLSNATWQQRTESTLVQIMACCLTAPSYYLNQRWWIWLIISEVLWHSHEGHITEKPHGISHDMSFNASNLILKTYFPGQMTLWRVQSVIHVTYCTKIQWQVIDVYTSTPVTQSYESWWTFWYSLCHQPIQFYCLSNPILGQRPLSYSATIYMS